MERIPLVCGGRETGAAEVERRPPYTVVRIHAPYRPGLWCAWAVGDAGEVRIGILEPTGGESGIVRRFSRQALEPAGELSRVELRPGGGEGWAAADGTEFPETGRRIPGAGGVMTRTDGERRFFAIPCGGAFPWPDLFCFARMERVGGRECWVFGFDGGEWPLMPGG